MSQLYKSSLKAMLRKSTWMGVRYLALGDTFQDTTYRMLLAQVDKLHAAIADRDVTCDDLRGALDLVYEGQLLGDLLSYVDATSKLEPAHDSLVRELIARELASAAAEKIIGNMNAELDLDTPAAILERAMDCQNGGLASPTMTLDQLDLPSADTERGKVLPLGISTQLDAAIGGAGSGELVVIFAPPRRGKTTVMRMIGASMVKRGCNVLDITLETSAAKIGRLYERAMLHKRRSEWTDEDTIEARRILFERGGNLWLKDLSHTDVTPDSIEGLIRSLQRDTGQRVDAVVLDYLELMTPSRSKNLGDSMMRYMYGRLGKQVRAIGRKFEIPIITGWQANRDGSQKDTLSEIDISECYDLFKHTDTMIALNRTEAERANDRMRLGILKQREDDEAPRSVTVFCNFGTMTMHDEERNYAIHQPVATLGASDGGGAGIARRPSLRDQLPSTGIHSGEGI